MGKRSNTLGPTEIERTPVKVKRLTTDFRPEPTSFKAWTSESTLKSMTDPRAEAEGRMLDMINKVQMLQIAGDKVNSSLLHRKKSPLFHLNIQKQPLFADSGETKLTQ